MNFMTDVFLDNATPDGCFSICRQRYVEVDGVRENIGQPNRCAFHPGQLEELKEYAPEMEEVAKAVWTQSVIEKWREKALDFE